MSHDQGADPEHAEAEAGKIAPLFSPARGAGSRMRSAASDKHFERTLHVPDSRVPTGECPPTLIMSPAFITNQWGTACGCCRRPRSPDQLNLGLG
ncbi:hypothetical protein [Azotobacter armeniacus]